MKHKEAAQAPESLGGFLGESYDAKGQVRLLHETDLKQGAIGTLRVTGVALGFNAPAWIAATTIPLMYATSGIATPLTILIAFLFPMLVLCFCFIVLVRRYPSAGGVFTFADRIIHPRAGSFIGWVYAVACLMIVPLTSLVGATYLQFLIPALRPVPVVVLGSVIVLVYLGITLRGVELTATTGLFLLTIESLTVLAIGLAGIVSPRDHISIIQMYNGGAAPQGWLSVFSGVLLGIFLLANFDSAINMIEEARAPVRTVQRALLATIVGEFIIYSVAAIGWARAVQPSVLVHLPASYQGTALTYVGNVYLHGTFLEVIPAIVVVTSALANLQMAMNAGAREAYRMAKEGKLPRMFTWAHPRYKTPWATAFSVTGIGLLLIWLLGDSEALYINSVTLLWVASYTSAAVAFILLAWRQTKSIAILIVPGLAVAMMLYAGATAGGPSLEFGGAWLGAGVVLVIVNELRGRHQRPTVAAAGEDGGNG